MKHMAAAGLRLATLLTAIWATPAGAQAPAPAPAGQPGKPVRLIVGFAPGTGPDTIARMLGQRLSEGWGKVAVVVDNKPGAGGVIAAAEAARAAPDGHTLLLAELGQLSIAPHIYSKLPYDPQKDFVAVSQISSAGFVLLIDPKRVPARNLREFIDWSKKQPQGIFMGSFGPGTPGHFAAAMFGDAAKLKVETVHYRAPTEAIGGLLSGDVQGAFVSVGFAVGQIKGGKLTGIANTAAGRSAVLPEVPTMKEQGFPAFDLTAWAGIVAPAKTPADTVARLAADIQQALTGETRAKLEEMGTAITATGPQQFARIIAADTQTWGQAVAKTGFKID